MARQGSTHGDVADDERTPLLATSVSPRPPRSTRPRPSAPPRDTKRDTLTLPWLARSLAALRAGHLPSSQQLLALARTLLDSPFLSDAHADAHVTHAATLSKEGEKVQTAVRRAVESLSELVRGRNPWVCWDEERDEWIGRAGEVDGPGDGWQEFVSACRRTSVDIDLPSTTLPAPSPADLAAAQSSLLTLVQLPLTSPAFLSLVSDLVMLLRDLVTATLDKAETDDLINVEAGEAVKSVVEGVAADVVCQGDTPAKIEGRPPPGNSAQEMEDDIVHRLQQILVQLQATQAYQGATRTLLSLARSYIRNAIAELTPSVDVETTAPPSTAVVPVNPAYLLVPLLEPFTGGPSSLSPLRTSFKTLISHLSPSNPATTPHVLAVLVSQLDSLIERALLEPGWVGSRQCYRDIGHLQETASQLGREDPDLHAAARDFSSRLVEAVSKVASDPLLRQAAMAIEGLGEAMVGWIEVAGWKAMQVVEGEPLNAVWADLVEWMWPRVVGVLAETSLPRIEFASPAVSLAIEPPSLLSTSLVPSSISIHQTTDLTYTPSHGTSTLALPLSASVPAPHASSLSSRTSALASTRLEITGLRLEIENVGYFASYHTGIPCFPTLTESGLLDLRLGHDTSGGLSFSLLSSTPSPSSTAQTLFEVDHSATHVTLEDFAIRPHHSSHPWLMWLLRPILQKAVRMVVEKEVKEKVLEAGAECIGRVGWEVRARERELRREEERQQSQMRGTTDAKASAKQAVWRWLKAGWQVLLGNGDDDERPSPPPAPSPASTTAPTLDDVHVNQHGITLDLPEEEATVGLGSEGVVLPPGEAPIPHPDGRKKGLRRAVRDEVQSEVREGQRIGRKVMRLPGEIEEARDEWEDYGRRQPRCATSWRSEAFDL